VLIFQTFSELESRPRVSNCEAVVGSLYNFVHDEAVAGGHPALRRIRSPKVRRAKLTESLPAR
jgi:hypothetical protein